MITPVGGHVGPCSLDKHLCGLQFPAVRLRVGSQASRLTRRQEAWAGSLHLPPARAQRRLGVVWLRFPDGVAGDAMHLIFRRGFADLGVLCAKHPVKALAHPSLACLPACWASFSVGITTQAGEEVEASGASCPCLARGHRPRAPLYLLWAGLVWAVLLTLLSPPCGSEPG